MNHSGKLVMVDVPSTSLDPDTVEHLRRIRPGGVCLFKKNVTDRQQLRALVEELVALLGPELLVAIDQEGGGVIRTSDLPYPPSGMSLGASDDPDLARQVGAMTARGLRASGINWNFAPDLDVNNNPLNPVISDRSYGENPTRVADLALAWAEGAQGEGVATCGKHFPGHGDTRVDSHLDLPRVERDQAGLGALEFLPFKRAVQAGIPALMTAHIVYPQLDALPATLSRRILTGLLRDEWGYDGVTITDSMGMAAIDHRWGRGEAGVMALQAGADMVMALGAPEKQRATLDAIDAARERGDLDEAQLARSAARLSALAKRFPPLAQPYGQEQEAADRRLAEEAWLRGITSYRNPQLPQPGSRITLVAVEGVPGEYVAEAGISGGELSAALAQVYDVQPVLYPLGNPAAALDAARAAQGTIVFASSGRHRMSEEARALAAAARPALHLALWNPYSVLDVDGPALITYGYRPEAIAALVRVLRGDAQAQGKAPVTLA